MSEDTSHYYSIAVIAMRVRDDVREIGLNPGVLRVDPGGDLDACKGETALEMFPTADGWTGHEIRHYRIADAIINLEKTLAR